MPLGVHSEYIIHLKNHNRANPKDMQNAHILLPSIVSSSGIAPGNVSSCVFGATRAQIRAIQTW